MKIAWIGLGNMGLPMAANAVKAGHDVAGFDLAESAMVHAARLGVVGARSAAEAAAGADVVFTMLQNGRQVEAVLLGEAGIASSLAPGTIVIDSSTIDIATARGLHERLTGNGLRFLDAPVSGGVFGAQAGSLTFMVGGDVEVLETVRPLVESMAARILHAGGSGSGQAAKLANNLMLAVNTAGLCEGAVLAERLGLDAKVFYEIAMVSSGQSWALKNWYPRPGVVQTAAVNRDFEGGFSVALMKKDLGLALAAGSDAGLELRSARMAGSYLDTMVEIGWADKDTASIVKLVDGSVYPPTPA